MYFAAINAAEAACPGEGALQMIAKLLPEVGVPTEIIAEIALDRFLQALKRDIGLPTLTYSKPSHWEEGNGEHKIITQVC